MIKMFQYKVSYIRYNNEDFKDCQFCLTKQKAKKLVEGLSKLKHLSKFKIEKIGKENEISI